MMTYISAYGCQVTSLNHCPLLHDIHPTSFICFPKIWSCLWGTLR